MILHAREDMDEVVEGIDPARLARRRERVQPGQAPTRSDIADEEVVRTPERDPPQRALRSVLEK